MEAFGKINNDVGVFVVGNFFKSQGDVSFPCRKCCVDGLVGQFFSQFRGVVVNSVK